MRAGAVKPGMHRGGAARNGKFVAGAVLAALLTVAAGGVVLSLWIPVFGTRFTAGGPFTLMDTEGRTVTDRTFLGKYMLVYFGYTFCPDVCPATLNNVADALDRLGPAADAIAPIFITVDPRRDTPAAMKQFTAAFTPRLIGLTGTADQIASAAAHYKVYYAVHRTGTGVDDYSMDHSSLLYLMGPDGAFIAPVRAEDPGAAMAAAIAGAMRLTGGVHRSGAGR